MFAVNAPAIAICSPCAGKVSPSGALELLHFEPVIVLKKQLGNPIVKKKIEGQQRPKTGYDKISSAETSWLFFIRTFTGFD